MSPTLSNLSSLLITLVLHAWATTPIQSRPTHLAKPEQEPSELFRKYHVHVIHDMTDPSGSHPNIDIRCWSNKDHLPERIMYYQQEYLIRFMIDLFWTTRFLCFMKMSALELQFEAFDAPKDEFRCHKGTCFWAVRADGVYFSKDNATWDREFQWRAPPPPPSLLY